MKQILLNDAQCNKGATDSILHHTLCYLEPLPTDMHSVDPVAPGGTTGTAYGEKAAFWRCMAELQRHQVT